MVSGVTNSFQFLMVRLKASTGEESSTEREPVFQFLMVRLKVSIRTNDVMFATVSIPYGSIKSQWVAALDFFYLSFNSLWFD